MTNLIQKICREIVSLIFLIYAVILFFRGSLPTRGFEILVLAGLSLILSQSWKD